MFTLGTVVGSVLAVTVLGLLIGLAFESKAPTERALLAALLAWIVAGILAGFGTADGGPFRFDAILTYLPGAVVAFFILRWNYSRNWVEDEA